MESLITQSSAPSSRRDFFKRAGAGVSVLGAAAVLQACDSEDPGPMATGVELDFSNDVGVLNFAYALEQLEAAFYAKVISLPTFATLFPATEQPIIRDIAAHEAVHDDFFMTAIGAAAMSQRIPRLTANFADSIFATRASILATSLTFEDLGVSAYNGAGRYLTSATYLTLAGKIVSVEARHASIIAGLITPNAVAGAGQIDANGLDKARKPREVLALAQPYIVETITVKAGTGL